MQILKQNQWLVYVLCAVVAISPAYYVWVHFPEIRSKAPERQKAQLAGIFGLAAIPFIGVCIGILLERYGRSKN
jgi:hypothetical protein